MKRRVFLSGPIRGLPREESLGWRITAGQLLGAEFETLHALRGREDKETLPDPRLAVARDLEDIRRSDILLVNDTYKECSMIGTSMEVFFAHREGKTVIVFGNAHEKDYWLNYHIHFRAPDLEEACSVIKKHFSQ